MKNLTLDFETYWDAQYTIKKLSVVEYVRDPTKFKVQGVGLKLDEAPTRWVTENISEELHALDWANINLIGANLYFDGSILFEHFNIVPGRRTDVQSMARALFPRDVRVNLNNLAEMLGLGHKIKGALDKTKGVRDLPPGLLAELGVYCINDVDLTWEVYNTLLPAMPESELDLIDMTTRMATAPVLRLNKTEVALAYEEAKHIKETAIQESGVDEKVLSSNQQFVAHLTSLGIKTPMKTNAKGIMIPALGQSDPEFLELMSEYPEHQKLWDGRAEAKSNIGISRAKKWQFIRTHGSCKMPMPLVYCGAHTTRWTGTDKLNVQNLPRGGKLRTSIEADDGYVILVGDSSQIELRLSAWFCGQTDVLDTVRAGRCVYRKRASELFNKPEEEITKHERGVAKALVLGCGYGMGPPKFKRFCASGPLGMPPMHFTSDESSALIQGNRTSNHRITGMWRELDGWLAMMMDPTLNEPFKCLQMRHESIVLPNGLLLDYEGLRCTEGDGYRYGNNHPIWGGTLLENIIQALARIVVSDQMRAVDKLPGVQVVGCTHDEIIAVCPERYADLRFDQIITIMSQAPNWAPGLPLAAEGGWAKNYSK